jgi:hypothetical protein
MTARIGRPSAAVKVHPETRESKEIKVLPGLLVEFKAIQGFRARQGFREFKVYKVILDCKAIRGFKDKLVFREFKVYKVILGCKVRPEW